MSNSDEEQRINANETPRRIASGDTEPADCLIDELKPRTRYGANSGPANRPKSGGAWPQRARGSSVHIIQTKARQNGRKHRHSFYVLSGFSVTDRIIESTERKQYMGENTGMNQLTAEQRLAEIALCLAQGIVDLHKQGRLGIEFKEFSPDSPASLDFGSDSGLSVNSGSISDLSNNGEGATNVVECN
jgi:hypothetical protein